MLLLYCGVYLFMFMVLAELGKSRWCSTVQRIVVLVIFRAALITTQPLYQHSHAAPSDIICNIARCKSGNQLGTTELLFSIVSGNKLGCNILHRQYVLCTSILLIHLGHFAASHFITQHSTEQLTPEPHFTAPSRVLCSQAAICQC